MANDIFEYSKKTNCILFSWDSDAILGIYLHSKRHKVSVSGNKKALMELGKLFISVANDIVPDGYTLDLDALQYTEFGEKTIPLKQGFLGPADLSIIKIQNLDSSNNQTK